jgi:hypothetical protein
MRHCERVHRCKGIAAESRCGAKVKDRTLSIISRGAASEERAPALASRLGMMLAPDC